MIEAYIEKSSPEHGLQISFHVSKELEKRLRRAFNIIDDNADISESMRHLLEIAIDGVEFLEKNKERII